MFTKLILIAICAFATEGATSNATLAERRETRGFRSIKETDDLITGQCTGYAPRKTTKCYAIFCNVKTNWFGANNFCNSIGMRLATVENQEQQNEMMRVKQNSDCWNPTDYVWIGGHNLARGTKYTWMPTGQAFGYNSFNPGQPDNANNKEHCVEIRGGGWNDRACEDELPLMCESIADCAQA